MKQFPDVDEWPLDSYEKDKAHFGKDVADLRRQEDIQEIRPTLPEGIEIDHTELDLFVVSEKTKLPLSRLWLTVNVCRFTRLILSFQVSLVGRVEE